MRRLSEYETVETCLQLCSQSRNGRNETLTKDGTYYTSLNEYCLSDHIDYNGSTMSECSVSTKMDYVDHGRYGSLKAPSNMVKAIRLTTHRLMDVFENEHGINSMVISGIHEHAILAYYVSTCMQTLLACKHWQTCSYPGILCVSFGLPKYWHNRHCVFEHLKVVMLDDWFVLSPFTINLRTSRSTFWIGEVSKLAYVCNTMMSMFSCVHSMRDIVHYSHEWSKCKPVLTGVYVCNDDENYDILVDPSSSTL
jgi:hypothetical protein